MFYPSYYASRVEWDERDLIPLMTFLTCLSAHLTDEGVEIVDEGAIKHVKVPKKTLKALYKGYDPAGVSAWENYMTALKESHANF